MKARSPFLAYYRSRSRLVFWLIAMLLAYAALAPATGCSKWTAVATAMRASILVTQAASAADRLVGKHLEDEHGRCKAAHTPKTLVFAACAAPALALHRKWKIARTSVAALNVLVQGALTEYYLYLKGKAGGIKMQPLKVAARAVCTLSKALTELEKVIPAIGKAAGILSAAQGFACALSSGCNITRWYWADAEAARVLGYLASLERGPS
ncbi:MAG: hypothetical protein V3V34_11735 [Kiloniellales bacterium]